MAKTSTFVGITIPFELYNKIESERGDVPRSYVYKKLIEGGYQHGYLPKIGILN